MTIHNFDLLVVGGGINGTGIARDAAGRHLSVCLCEQHDLASHTSSASTKLIHGGLRYFGILRICVSQQSIGRTRNLATPSTAHCQATAFYPPAPTPSAPHLDNPRGLAAVRPPWL